MCGGYSKGRADLVSTEIKMLGMDVDGTLTDGKIYMGSQGEVCKAFNIKDGLGINRFICHGMIPVIITGRKSDIVENRAKELGITEIYQGVQDKDVVLEQVAQKYGITLKQVAYIGDDCNDLAVMKAVGMSFAPADAVSEVLDYVDVVVKSKGGEGAVREVVDYLLRRKS